MQTIPCVVVLMMLMVKLLLRNQLWLIQVGLRVHHQQLMLQLRFLRFVFLSFFQESILNHLLQILSIYRDVLSRQIGFCWLIFDYRKQLVRLFGFEVLCDMLVIGRHNTFVSVVHWVLRNKGLIMRDVQRCGLLFPFIVQFNVFEFEPLCLVLQKFLLHLLGWLFLQLFLFLLLFNSLFCWNRVRVFLLRKL